MRVALQQLFHRYHPTICIYAAAKTSFAKKKTKKNETSKKKNEGSEMLEGVAQKPTLLSLYCILFEEERVATEGSSKAKAGRTGGAPQSTGEGEAECVSGVRWNAPRVAEKKRGKCYPCSFIIFPSFKKKQYSCYLKKIFFATPYVV